MKVKTKSHLTKFVFGPMVKNLSVDIINERWPYPTACPVSVRNVQGRSAPPSVVLTEKLVER